MPKIKNLIKIVSDSPDFKPIWSNDVLSLFGSIPPDVNQKKTLILASRTANIVDCGISITFPKNLKPEVVAPPFLMKKGVRADILIENGKVNVVLTHMGKEIIPINYKDLVAYMHFVNLATDCKIEIL